MNIEIELEIRTLDGYDPITNTETYYYCALILESGDHLNYLLYDSDETTLIHTLAKTFVTEIRPVLKD